jgi:DNA-binding winged helix-turn-helix (wHTH) protein/tetratricopeptide (TPR) repeat protein
VKARFGDCELDTDQFVLVRSGKPVSVQPLVLRSLAYLVENRERVIGKEELRDAVWRGVVVGPGSFNQAMSLLRKAIGDDSTNPSMIKTVRGLGWQFVARIEAREAAPASAMSLAVHARSVVGRDVEIGLVEGAFLEAVEEGAELCVIEGEPGIGKSSLLEAASERLGRRGAWVLATACREDKARMPLWPWTPVIRAIFESPFVDEAHEIGGVREAVLEMFPQLRPAGNVIPPPRAESAASRVTRFDAVAELIASASERQPLVLMFDDVHCADIPSLRLIEHVVAQLDGKPVFVCVTHRSGEAPGGVDGFAVPGARRFVLQGLTRRASSELLRRRTGNTPTDALLDASMRLTSGSPLLLTEAARVITNAGAGAALVRLESRFRAPESGTLAVRGFVDALAEPVRALGRIASVFGRHFTLRWLARLADRDAASCVELLAPIVEAGLLVREGPDDYVITHELFRHALYGSLPAVELSTLHARAASLYDDDPDEDSVFLAAHHHYLGLDRTDPLRAFGALSRAGEQAFARGAFEDAAVYFEQARTARERASDHGEQARDVAMLLVRRGHALRCAGKASPAIGSFVEAAKLARTLNDGALITQCALGYGATQRGFGDFQLIALLREALDRWGPHDPPTEARLGLELSLALRQTPDQKTALELAQRAVERARAIGDSALLSRALVAQRWNAKESEPIAELVATSREAFDLASASGDLALVNDARLCVAWDLMSTGDCEGLQREVRAYKAAAQRLGHGYDQIIAARFEVVATLAIGNFEHADVLATEALRLGRAGGDSTTDIVRSIQLLLPARERGRLVELDNFIRLMDQIVPKPSIWRAALALSFVESDRADAAREVLHDMIPLLATANRQFNYLPMIAFLVEVSARLGESAIAERLAGELRPYTDRHLVLGGASLYLGPMRRYLGVALAAAGAREEAESELVTAVAEAQRSASPYWLSRTEVDLARLRGDRVLAQRVADTADTSGWGTIAREARAVLMLR